MAGVHSGMEQFWGGTQRGGSPWGGKGLEGVALLLRTPPPPWQSGRQKGWTLGEDGGKTLAQVLSTTWFNSTGDGIFPRWGTKTLRMPSPADFSNGSPSGLAGSFAVFGIGN